LIRGDMSTILVGNVEKDHFEKQPSEKMNVTVDFAEDLGSSGNVTAYSVHAIDDSGVSVDATILSGYHEQDGIVTFGVQSGENGKIYTITSKVTSDQTLPDNVTGEMFEADIFMRVSEKK